MRPYLAVVGHVWPYLALSNKSSWVLAYDRFELRREFAAVQKSIPARRCRSSRGASIPGRLGLSGAGSRADHPKKITFAFLLVFGFHRDARARRCFLRGAIVQYKCVDFAWEMACFAFLVVFGVRLNTVTDV